MARTPREILFRLRQEAANLAALLKPEEFRGSSTTTLPLPEPGEAVARLKDSAFAAAAVAVAEGSLRREFRLLGYSVQTGREIRWRKDYVHGPETGLSYFRRVPYLDAARCGDHKVIWELNRHQHLVAAAQAYLFTRREEFLDDIWIQLESWMEQNPPGRGVNWTSALEIAFRALSWLWIDHMVGRQAPERFRERWLTALFQHGRHLQRNLSVYFSPNTHLQGEALALHALGIFFDVELWRRTGSKVLHSCMQTHIRDDGSHFEQSSYYHLYAVDMFLLHAQLAPVSEEYKQRLKQALGFLWSLSSSGEMPLLGDDDGGRLFHPYGARSSFARATLATGACMFGDTPWHGDPHDLEDQAAWWAGTKNPAAETPAVISWFYPDAGIAILNQRDLQAVVDTRAFGFGGAGHSHAHALHFTLRRGNEQILIDPGTYTYVGEPAARDLFRGTRMHNTAVVDGLDQATPDGPFRWRDLPVTSVRHYSGDPWRLEAQCEYRGARHTRRMALVNGILFVLDSFGGAGHHRVEQMWHAGGAVRRVNPFLFELPGEARLVLPEDTAASLEEGWYSRVPGLKEPRPVIAVASVGEFPLFLAAAFLLDPAHNSSKALQVDITSGQIKLTAAEHFVHFETGN